MYPVLLYLECIQTYSRPGIDVALGINVAPGTLGKIIKVAPITIDLNLLYIAKEKKMKVFKNPKVIKRRSFNQDVVLGKSPKINKGRLRLFRSREYVC